MVGIRSSDLHMMKRSSSNSVVVTPKPVGLTIFSTWKAVRYAFRVIEVAFSTLVAARSFRTRPTTSRSTLTRSAAAAVSFFCTSVPPSAWS